MRLYSSFNFYASIYGAALAAILNLHEVAARIVASSDIRENIKESKSFAKKNMGEECIKLEADVSKTKEDTENVDVGVLGCGELLICLEDASSSTGARCVDFWREYDPNQPDPFGPCALQQCGEKRNGDGEYDPCCEGFFCSYGYCYKEFDCLNLKCGSSGECCEGFSCIQTFTDDIGLCKPYNSCDYAFCGKNDNGEEYDPCCDGWTCSIFEDKPYGLCYKDESL